MLGASPLTRSEELLCKSVFAAVTGLVAADGGIVGKRTLSEHPLRASQTGL